MSHISIIIPITSREIIDKIIIIQEAIAMVDPDLRYYFIKPYKLKLNLGKITVEKKDIPIIKFALKHVIYSIDWKYPYIECCGIEKYTGISNRTIYMKVKNLKIFQIIKQRIILEFLKINIKGKNKNLNFKSFPPIIPIMRQKIKLGFNINSKLFVIWQHHQFGRQVNLKLQLIESEKEEENYVICETNMIDIFWK